MSRRLLQVCLRVVGSVAVVFGLQGVAAGVGGVRGAAATVDRNVDSELRFFAAWYVFAGAVLLRAARRPEAETFAVRTASAACALGAAGRVLSMRKVGRPHPLYVALLGIEVAVPAVLVPWHGRVVRRAKSARPW